jgi:hypothetical protein
VEAADHATLMETVVSMRMMLLGRLIVTDCGYKAAVAE